MFFEPNIKYLVLGASTNPSKFGNRILKWYISNNLPVVPINPTNDEVLGIKAYPTLNTYLNASGAEVSISVVTPPSVSLEMLKDVKNVKKIHSVWFQPGSYNATVVEYVKELGIDVIVGDCILVNGKQLLANIKDT